MDDLVVSLEAFSFCNNGTARRFSMKGASSAREMLIFPFETSETSETRFQPRLKAEVQYYALRDFSWLNNLKQREDAACLPQLKSSVRKHALGDVEDEEVLQEPLFSRSALVPQLYSTAKCTFRTRTLKKVAHRIATKKISFKIKMRRKENSCPIFMDKLKSGVVSAWAKFEVRGRGDKPDSCSEEQCLGGVTSKRKFRFPHHVLGKGLIDPREFALLEKKICGSHKSKKPRNARGFAPRSPSKQSILEILSNKDPRISRFESFLTSSFRASDFMKSIPRTLTEFTCFSRLPTEMQDLIWEHALPEHRLVMVSNNVWDRGTARMGTSRFNELAQQCQSPIFDLVYRRSPSARSSFTKEDFLCERAASLREAHNRLFMPSIVFFFGRQKSMREETRGLLLVDDIEVGPRNERSWQRSRLVNHWKRAWEVPDWYHRPQIIAPFDAVSSLLQTTKGSRGQVLLHYEPAFERKDGSKQYCNFQSDAIYLKEGTGITLNVDSFQIPALAKDFGKVRHLVIGSRFIAEQAGRIKRIDSIELMEMIFEKVAVLFPNIERLTLDQTRFVVFCKLAWDSYTSICSTQRFVGDAWFSHLPCTAHRFYGPGQTVVSWYTIALEGLRNVTRLSPTWKPTTEIREVALRKRGPSTFWFNKNIKGNFTCLANETRL